MFKTENFTLPSVTQEMKSNLVAALPDITFGLFTADRTVKASDIKTIAFGVWVNGVKQRHGSIVIEQDYILILAMDNRNEYRAKDKWDCIYFLNKLRTNNYDWDKTLDV